MFIFQNAEKNRPPENHFPPPKICSTVYPFAPKKRLIPAKSNSFRLRFAKEVYKNLMYASTLSLRRATDKRCELRRNNRNFYPRSPCGERPSAPYAELRSVYFYPRSPCGERPWARGSRVTYVEFLSTLSLRRATLMRYRINARYTISIHALLAESDAGLIFCACDVSLFLSTLSLRRATYQDKFSLPPDQNFYPRSPCGERPRTQSAFLSA